MKEFDSYSSQTSPIGSVSFESTLNIDNLPKYMDSWIKLICLGDQIIDKKGNLSLVTWLINAKYNDMYLKNKNVILELYIVLYDPIENHDIIDRLKYFNATLPFHTFGFVLSTKDKARYSNEQFSSIIPLNCNVLSDNIIKLTLNIKTKKLIIKLNNTKKTMDVQNNYIFKESNKLCLSLYSIICRAPFWSKFHADCIDYIHLEGSDSKWKQHLCQYINKSKTKQKELQHISDLILTPNKLPKYNIIEYNQEFME